MLLFLSRPFFSKHKNRHTKKQKNIFCIRQTDGIGSSGHGSQVSDLGRVGSGHRSVCQTWCLTQFWVLTCVFVVNA